MLQKKLLEQPVGGSMNSWVTMSYRALERFGKLFLAVQMALCSDTIGDKPFCQEKYRKMMSYHTGNTWYRRKLFFSVTFQLNAPFHGYDDELHRSLKALTNNCHISKFLRTTIMINESKCIMNEQPRTFIKSHSTFTTLFWWKKPPEQIGLGAKPVSITRCVHFVHPKKPRGL